MKQSLSINRISFLQVNDKGIVHCGSNQDWYRQEEQRLKGCGPSVAANILFYLQRKKNVDCCGTEKADLLACMEYVWRYVTPEWTGIPSTELFCSKVDCYAKSCGKQLDYHILNINPARKPVLSAVVNFLWVGLQRDLPIAFLNLCNGAEQQLEPWHWVTISGLDYDTYNQYAIAQICDGGIVKRIDLALWLHTTRQGGGFVFFYDTEIEIFSEWEQ